MSESTTDSGFDQASAETKVKDPKNHASKRLTPPKPVRDAVGMIADEPWSWFYHVPTGHFWLRRSGASLSGIPTGESIAAGTAEPRNNGRYMDYAIPPSAVDAADLEKGDTYLVEALDRNTIRLVPQDE